MLSERNSLSGSSEEAAREEDDELVGEEEEEELDDYGDEQKVVKKRAGRSREESGTSMGSRGQGVEHKTQAAFVHKLHSMVETPSLSHLIGWGESGLTFSVRNPAEFSRVVLPQFFKHQNFNSFVRQLNMYGFHKVNDLFNNGPPLAHSSVEDPIPWEFQHSCFRRDRPDVLVNIKRKSSKAPVPTVLPRRSKSGSNSGSNHSSTAAAELGLVDSGNAGASSSTGEHLYGQFGGASSSRDRGPQGEFSQRTTPFNATSDRNSAPPYPPLPRLPSGTPSYPSPSTRPSQIGGNDDTLAAISRQLVGLETHVRGLSEALYQSQQEAMVVRQEAAVERAGSYAVLRTLLNVVAGMDSSEERREDIESVQYALEKLNPDSSYLSPNSPLNTFIYPPQSIPLIPTPPRTKPTPPPFFTYSRPTLPAESFARGGAPPFQEQQYSTYPPTSSAPLHDSYRYPDRPTPLRVPAGGVDYGYRSQSAEYGYAWGGEQGVPLRRGSVGGRGSEMLPPLASLLGAEGRRRVYEGEDDEARKKVRR